MESLVRFGEGLGVVEVQKQVEFGFSMGNVNFLMMFRLRVVDSS